VAGHGKVVLPVHQKRLIHRQIKTEERGVLICGASERATNHRSVIIRRQFDSGLGKRLDTGKEIARKEGNFRTGKLQRPRQSESYKDRIADQPQENH